MNKAGATVHHGTERSLLVANDANCIFDILALLSCEKHMDVVITRIFVTLPLVFTLHPKAVNSVSNAKIKGNE